MLVMSARPSLAIPDSLHKRQQPLQVRFERVQVAAGQVVVGQEVDQAPDVPVRVVTLPVTVAISRLSWTART